MVLRTRGHPLHMKWKLRILLILSTFVTSVIVFLQYYADSEVEIITSNLLRIKNYYITRAKMIDSHPGYWVYTSGCRIPQWDPYDASLHHLIMERKRPFKCPGKPPFLKVEFNATITVDDNILTYYGITKDNISCTYRSILRDPSNAGLRADAKFRYGNVTKLSFNVPLREEFLEITCSMRSRLQFTDYIALVPLKPDVEMRAEQAFKERNVEETLNINLIAIDSVSKLNFLRHFPETYKFLKENLSPIELRGYNKVGDNTFVNIVPLLTGHFVEHYWNESKTDFFFDEVDLIWKKYSKHGYRTLYAEDSPYFGTFNYLKNGFFHPPTDYYLRPFIIALDSSKMKKRSKDLCYQSKPIVEVFNDYLKNFVKTMGFRPFFAFTFTSMFTHDDLNNAGYADDPTYRLLRNLSDSEIFNRSLTVFFSDHGIRFGPIRQTYIGKTEERMPFMFLLFPPWFLKKYPKIAENLKINERRLTTPFDIHATLVHLLNFTGDSTNYVPSPLLTPHGISLFNEVPESRTCSNASILQHWCTCHMYTAVNKTDIKIIEAANAVIDTINNWLKPYNDKCVPLRMSDIIDARVGQQNEQVMRFVRHENDVINRHVVLGDKIEGPVDYLLTILVSPSGGEFEATVRFQNSLGVYKVFDEISRINRYGHQSKCVDNSRIQKFCYCRELMTFGESMNSSYI